jgi:hypothetical protein
LDENNRKELPQSRAWHRHQGPEFRKRIPRSLLSINEFSRFLLAQGAGRDTLVGISRRTRMSDTEVFEALVPLLCHEIPKQITNLDLKKPIFRLRIYYYDTHAPSTYLLLVPSSDEFRKTLIAKHGGVSREQLWVGGSGSDLPTCELRGPPEIATLFAQVYELLDEKESLYMVQFRAMLHRVAWRLNGLDWSKFCQVTDDFFVLPQDGSAHFDNGWPDVVRSIPPDRLEILRAKGFGPPDLWQDLPSE